MQLLLQRPRLRRPTRPCARLRRLALLLLLPVRCSQPLRDLDSNRHNSLVYGIFTLHSNCL